MVSVSVTGQNDWALALNKDGIEIYVQETPGSDYYSFKAIMSVSHSEEDILNILKDVESYPDWFAYTSSVQLLYSTPEELQSIMETDFPWPYHNECKNYVMTFNKSDPGHYKILIKGTEENNDCEYSFNLDYALDLRDEG